MKRSSGGFLLIEIMIAFGLLIGIAVISALYVGRIVDQQHETKAYLQATTLARTFLDELLCAQKLPNKLSQERDGFILTCKTSQPNQPKYTTPITLLPAFLKNFAIITVTVSWKAISGNKKSISLVSGMLMKGR